MRICFVRGPFRTPNPQNIKKWSVRKLFTLLGHFLIVCLDLVGKMFKNTFSPCSYIELNTQTPNTIFKIEFYYTKYTNNKNTFEILETFRFLFKSNCLFCILYKFHNSFFVNIEIFGFLVILVFCIFYITRVGLLHV